MSKRNLLGLVIAIQLIILAGCSVVNPVNPNVNAYTLDSVSTKTVGARSESGALLVMIPSANPGYQSRQMIYIEEPFQLRAFARNEWVAPPAQMLQPLIEESLRNTGHFRAVVAQPFAGMSDVRLQVQLVKLQQEFMFDPSQVLLEVKADLINSKTNEILASKLFSAEVPASANSPRAGVAAANEATQIILEQLAEFVVHAGES